MNELEVIREIVQDVLNYPAEKITEDTNLVDDIGADSLDLFQIITAIEDHYGIELDMDHADKIKTVGDAVEEIRALLKA